MANGVRKGRRAKSEKCEGRRREEGRRKKRRKRRKGKRRIPGNQYGQRTREGGMDNGLTRPLSVRPVGVREPAARRARPITLSRLIEKGCLYFLRGRLPIVLPSLLSFSRSSFGPACALLLLSPSSLVGHSCGEKFRLEIPLWGCRRLGD